MQADTCWQTQNGQWVPVSGDGNQVWIQSLMSRTYSQTVREMCRLSASRWSSGFAVLGLTLLVGCQCWGPSATCLRPHGPVISTTEALRQQHLERSQHQRQIPMFDRYLESGTDGHQQLPSSFHPVPTRNVFQPPMYSEPLWPGSNVVDPTAPPVTGENPSGEELPPPRGGSLDGWSDQESAEEYNFSTEPWEDADSARRPSSPTHREMVRYPNNKQLDRPVADWVRGNYGVDVRQSPRLHSALQPSGGIELRYR